MPVAWWIVGVSVEPTPNLGTTPSAAYDTLLLRLSSPIGLGRSAVLLGRN